MSRGFRLLLIFLALLPIFLFFIIQPPTNEYKEFNIINQDKKILLDYSYKVFNNYFNDNSTEITFPEIKNSNLNYNILFITLLKNGKVKGCQSGSTPLEKENRIFFDIKEALVESIEDTRFGGALKKEEIKDAEIMFTFLHNIKWLENKSELSLNNNIELGIHAVEIVYNKTSTIYKESVPISNNYELIEMFEKLCKKGEFENNCYTKEDADIYRYDSLTFMGKPGEKIIDLYRYNILVETKDITNELIYDSITLANDWYTNSVNQKTKTLEYLYYPSNDQYSTGNNHIRQLATLWALTELKSFLNINSNSDLINDTIDYYLKFKKGSENISFLTINNDSKLANSAFFILALINTPNYPNQTILLEEFAQGILSLQNQDGSFKTHFFSEKNTGIEYAPGEAMLSLMKYYNYTKESKYLDSVQKAFYYYRQYWQNHLENAFVPWHSQTYKLLFDETNDLEVAEFIFEMNDWIIDNYQINNSNYIDEIGGFPHYFPTFSTAVFLEGINDAYSVAVSLNDTEHIKKYKDSIINGTRFSLQIQFTKNNTFYLENKTRAIGGIKTSLTDNSIRIDNTQHAVMALMKAYKNNIFP